MNDKFYGVLIVYRFDGSLIGNGFNRSWLTKEEAQRMGENRYSDSPGENPRFAFCDDCMTLMEFDQGTQSWECPRCGNHVDTDQYEEADSQLFWESEDE